MQIFGTRFRGNRFSTSHWDGNRKREFAALTKLTFQLNFTLHLTNNVGRDRQSQTSASVNACGRRICLSERIKNRLAFFRGNANACVRNNKAKINAVLTHARSVDADHDFTLLSELDGIASQVDDNLA